MIAATASRRVRNPPSHRFLELPSPLWLDFGLLRALRRPCHRHHSDERADDAVAVRLPLAGSPSNSVKVSHSPLRASGPPRSGSRLPPLQASSASPGIPVSLSSSRLAPNPFAFPCGFASRLVEPLSTQGRIATSTGSGSPVWPGQSSGPDRSNYGRLFPASATRVFFGTAREKSIRSLITITWQGRHTHDHGW